MPEHPLLEEYDREVRVRILGREYRVPDNNTLLRILQYLSCEISYSRFCWNGDCHNCMFAYRCGPGVRKGLACQVKVAEGMEVTDLPEGIRLN
jgi:NADH dehydrogenase/NADH:ubiquinone oxidoreductase subunit G